MTKRNLSLVLSLLLALSFFVAPTQARYGETVKLTSANLFGAATITTGTSRVFALNAYDRVGLSVKWATGVNAGVIKLEFAATADEADAWQEGIALNVTAATTPPSTQSDALDVCAQYARVRVSTTVAGGGSPSAAVSVFLRRVNP